MHGDAYTLLVLADEEGEFDVDASIDAARRALPGLRIAAVVPIDEQNVGRWLAARRARRCRTVQEVRTTPERQQPAVLDADLPAGAWW